MTAIDDNWTEQERVIIQGRAQIGDCPRWRAPLIGMRWQDGSPSVEISATCLFFGVGTLWQSPR